VFHGALLKQISKCVKHVLSDESNTTDSLCQKRIEFVVVAGYDLAINSAGQFNREAIRQRQPLRAFQPSNVHPEARTHVSANVQAHSRDIAHSRPRALLAPNSHEVIKNFADVDSVGNASVRRIVENVTHNVPTRFRAQERNERACIHDTIHRRRSSRRSSRRFAAANFSLLVGTSRYLPKTASINSWRESRFFL
jgi:hypothetical protein